MRLLYISKSIIPSRTANSIHVMKMCNAFSNNGHSVRLLTADYKPVKENGVNNDFNFYDVPESFEISKLPYPEKLPGKSLVYNIAIWNVLRRGNYEIVYGRYIVGCWLAATAGFPVVYECHAPVATAAKFERVLLKRIIKTSNLKRIIVISEALKKILLKEIDYPEDKVVVSHDGADLPKVEKNNDLALGGRTNAVKVGYTGHLYKGKGIEVIAGIADRLPEIDFHVIGGTLELIEEWKSKIKSENVHFHGFVNQHTLTKYIYLIDICLLPNQKVVHVHSTKSSKNNRINISAYTSPLKMFEYMAHAKPIIFSNIPVLREVLNDKNAIPVQPDDFDQWVDSINLLTSNKSIRKEIADNAYQDFVNNYTWKIRANKVINFDSTLKKQINN